MIGLRCRHCNGVGVSRSMNFQSVLVLLHIAALALAMSSFLVLLRQLGTRTLSEAKRTTIRFNLRITSYTMLIGVLLVCFTSGALLCHQLLMTSALPPLTLLAIRVVSLIGATGASIFLHTLTMPMLKLSQGRKIVDAAPAANILACTLAASLAILSWAILLLSSTHPVELQSWRPAVVMPALSIILAILWIILSASLLGERSIKELKDFAWRVKKSLEPPTRIEMQRATRARRMHNMNLPMAPRKRATSA